MSYNCTKCNKIFLTEANLILHQNKKIDCSVPKLSSNGFPYCSYCGREFSYI